ncbi:hypothetical protein C5748_18170 [Phyllobacterium phragmitis]|uniref:Uncharacterized protein n=1 Tax=Phyllobacterium phragmitis TaxID=2670329 RepID=A0A2S9INL7_9HYPH|nr:hypothetical protein [Phyllobacterium phragmitis]PRD42082.1 hypothetical protein C5748_18170 [Phyllobacterium phragmitis]
MKTSFTACLTMPDGRTWTEINCEVSTSLDWNNGEPVLSIDDVRVDVSKPREPSQYVSLFCDTASPLMALMGHEICQLSEADDGLLTKTIEHEGHYRCPSPSEIYSANSAGRGI